MQRGLVLALALVTRAALAEDGEPSAESRQESEDRSEARRLTREGLEHYEGARYSEAITSFEAAYALLPLPLLLYNLGQAHRLKGDCPSAFRYYERFFETGPTGSVAQFVTARMDELRGCAQGARPGPTSKQETETAAPRRDTATTAEHTREGTRKTGARGASVSSPQKERAPQGPAAKSYLWPVILSGGAAVLLGTGSYFAWQSHDASVQVSRRFERSGGVWDASGSAVERRGKTYETISIAALAAGALLGGASVWVWTFD